MSHIRAEAVAAEHVYQSCGHDIVEPGQKFKTIEPWANTVSSLGLILSCLSLYSITIVATPTESSSL
jgi:hypothetical protein